MGSLSTDFLEYRRDHSSRRSRPFAGVLAVLLVLFAGALTYAWLRLPGFLEQRLRQSFRDKGIERVELSVTRVRWGRLHIRNLLLADPGWMARAEALTVHFQLPEGLTGNYEILDLPNLRLDLDIQRLLELEELVLPNSLRTLHRANSYRLVKLSDAVVHVQRGDAAERVRIDGEFRTQGPVDLVLAGEGLSPFQLELEGRADGPAGDADLQAELSSPNLLVLLEGFAPHWTARHPRFALGKVQLSAALRMREDLPSLASAEGTVAWKGWQGEAGTIGPTRIRFHRKGTTTSVKSDPFRVDLATGLTGQGFVEALFTPPQRGGPSRLAGDLTLEPWGLPDLALQPVVIPFSGPPGNLRFGAVDLASPDRPRMSLRDVWIQLQSAPHEAPFARAEGRLALRLPSRFAPSAQGERDAISLPASAEVRGESGDPQLRFAIASKQEHEPPLRLRFGSFEVEVSARATGRTRADGEAKAAVVLDLEPAKIVVLQDGEPLVTLSELDLDGRWDGNLEARGQGRFNGAPFPLRIRQTGSAGSPRTTSFSLGPLTLEDATWPGKIIEPWRDTRLSGTFRLEGSLLHPQSPGTSPKPDLAFHLLDAETVHPSENTTASGIEAHGRLVGLDPARFAPGISLTVERVSTPAKVDLAQIRLSISPLKTGEIRIDSFSAGILGGTVRLGGPVTIDPETESFAAVLELVGIQGSEVVKLFPKFGGEVEAGIDGRVPLAVEEGRVRLQKGTLSLDPDQPAYLRYDASGLLTEGMRERGRKYKINQSIERALGNLTINSLDVNLFDPAHPDHPAIIKLSGLAEDEYIHVPVNLTVPVEDEDEILPSLFSRVLSGGMNVSLEPDPSS